MSKRLSTLVLLSLAAIGGGPPGCGPSDETLKIKLVSVDGKVTLNGKPFAEARITFAPDESNEYQTPGSGITGPDGTYEAMYRGRPGLSPGTYKVIVEKIQTPEGEALVAKGDQTKDAASPIHGEFDGEVPAGGGSLDFDVQPKEPPAKASKK
jgi:hypothetical protein